MLPRYPNVDEILLILKSELPDGVYADDLADDQNPAKRSYSSSELRAMAQMIANLYSGLNDTFADKFLTTVTHDGLTPWEKELFALPQDGNQSDLVRQQNLLAKLRASGGISLPAITAVAAGILTPAGLPFEILAWDGPASDGTTGGWILEESPLDQGTYLGLIDPLLGAGRDLGVVPLDCNLDYAAAGITQQEMEDIQKTAYTYEVKIYGNADAATLDLLDRQLTALEPARSTHVITNNATPPIDPDTLIGDGWPIHYGGW